MKDYIEIEFDENGKPTGRSQIDLMVAIGEAVMKVLDDERTAPVDQAIADNSILFAMEWFK